MICLDIDECLSSPCTNLTGFLKSCNNTPGSYICMCNNGPSVDGNRCEGMFKMSKTVLFQINSLFIITHQISCFLFAPLSQWVEILDILLKDKCRIAMLKVDVETVHL